MGTSLAISAGYAAIGGTGVLAGAVAATHGRISGRAHALVQHAAAGTVLAGLVTDILAKLMHRPQQLAFTAIGLVAGLAGMLAIRILTPRGGDGGPGSLTVTITTDIVADGVLIGLSAALGTGTALLFAISLAPEMSLLGVTAASQLRGRWPPARIIAAAAAAGAAITGAGALGWVIAHASTPTTTAVLGAGASIIIYLILEELLREAHETDTGPIEVAVLFGCFVPFFLAGTAV